MKGRSVDEVIFDHLFPKPKTGEPPNFQAFLQRNLIPEVRQETQSFYGHLDTPEAKYPGLDYSHPTHRIRLARYTWHRRLFRAFDALGLTKSEISALTRWEGTLWAKQKYEKEQGVTIRDTTGEGIPDWVYNAPLPAAAVRSPPQHARVSSTTTLTADDDDDSADEQEAPEESGDEADGTERNPSSSMIDDEEWEQWLKNAIETGELTVLTEQMTQQLFRASGSSVIPAALIPPEMLSLARSGQWEEIPDFMHPMLRRALRDENLTGQSDAPLLPMPSRRQLAADSPSSRMRMSSGRRAYSDLRITAGGPASQMA